MSSPMSESIHEWLLLPIIRNLKRHSTNTIKAKKSENDGWVNAGLIFTVEGFSFEEKKDEEMMIQKR